MGNLVTFLRLSQNIWTVPVEILSTFGSTDHVNNLIVAIVSNFIFFEANSFQNCHPLIASYEGRGVHYPAVTNYQTVSIFYIQAIESSIEWFLWSMWVKKVTKHWNLPVDNLISQINWEISSNFANCLENLNCKINIQNYYMVLRLVNKMCKLWNLSNSPDSFTNLRILQLKGMLSMYINSR